MIGCEYWNVNDKMRDVAIRLIKKGLPVSEIIKRLSQNFRPTTPITTTRISQLRMNIANGWRKGFGYGQRKIKIKIDKCHSL